MGLTVDERLETAAWDRFLLYANFMDTVQKVFTRVQYILESLILPSLESLKTGGISRQKYDCTGAGRTPQWPDGVKFQKRC